MRLSIQHSVISEYTSMVALQTNLDAPKKVGPIDNLFVEIITIVYIDVGVV
jgi:hypothetical protein